MDFNQIIVALNAAVAAGEITKVRYNEIKDRVGRLVYAESDQIRKDYYLSIPYEQREVETEEMQVLRGLYYDMPSNLHEVKAFTKKVIKIKVVHVFVAAARKMAEKYAPAVALMDILKPMVVSSAKVREDKKAAQAVAMQKTFRDNGELLEVLRSHRAEFVKRNMEYAGTQYDNSKKAIADAGGLDNIAPRPSLKMSSAQYMAAESLRSWYSYIETTSRQHHVEEAGRYAEASFDAWVEKMVQKIGETTVSAKMTGSAWTGSTLTVVTESGNTQIWNTKIIINQSKYGKLFNQFPSRCKFNGVK